MKRMIAISLALLMLVSNLGLTMNTHYCAGKAVKTSFSLVLQNPDCGMALIGPAYYKAPDDKDIIKPKSCCENRHQVLQLDENADIQSSKINIDPVFVAIFVKYFVQYFLLAEQAPVQTLNTPSPLPDRDFQVLLQRFLI